MTSFYEYVSIMRTSKCYSYSVFQDHYPTFIRIASSPTEVQVNHLKTLPVLVKNERKIFRQPCLLQLLSFFLTTRAKLLRNDLLTKLFFKTEEQMNIITSIYMLQKISCNLYWQIIGATIIFLPSYYFLTSQVLFLQENLFDIVSLYGFKHYF